MRTIVLAAALLLLAIGAHAQPGKERQGSPPSPPQALIDACDGLSRGEQCTFTPPQGGTETGTCEPFGPQQENLLACRPQNAPKGPPPEGPPPSRQ